MLRRTGSFLTHISTTKKTPAKDSRTIRGGFLRNQPAPAFFFTPKVFGLVLGLLHSSQFHTSFLLVKKPVLCSSPQNDCFSRRKAVKVVTYLDFSQVFSPESQLEQNLTKRGLLRSSAAQTTCTGSAEKERVAP